ncbi:BRO-N domain-containing protein [Variovorax sp. PBL-E5]|uniref:BRO-N domain-containing protein n=1 Tax=Variovorax sp. PBL-E5 TaxID=434014 RepID=UPI001318EED2|nr:BRO family protein [Variovorax sp. PBL-E5]VTU29842.1 putative phage-encoded protein [Variovorax sp. PBL-E5]
MSGPSLQVFTFAPGMKLRSLGRGGEAWLLAMDVSKALDYSDAFEMTKRLDDDEKQNLQIAGFGSRGVTLINESGLYSAILGSHKPEAKAFKKWVTSVVLPTIRQHGAYGNGAEHLSASAQANLYAIVRSATQEALRRYDRETEHDHWASDKKRRAGANAAVAKVAKEMGLPVSVVASAASSGLDGALSSLR